MELRPGESSESRDRKRGETTGTTGTLVLRQRRNGDQGRITSGNEKITQCVACKTRDGLGLLSAHGRCLADASSRMHFWDRWRQPPEIDRFRVTNVVAQASFRVHMVLRGLSIYGFAAATMWSPSLLISRYELRVILSRMTELVSSYLRPCPCRAIIHRVLIHQRIFNCLI